jgi:hypothetical protein
MTSRVRGGYGKEKIRVCQFMEFTLVQNRGSYIAGRSVHNQRIERLWIDVWMSFTSRFVNIFYQLETEGILNVDVDEDIVKVPTIFYSTEQKQI